MEKRGIIVIFGIALIFSLIINVIALYQEDGELIDVEHALRVKNISMLPENLAPGQAGILKFKLINNAKERVTDVRAKLVLPSDIKPYKDVNVVKISSLESLESEEFDFQVIALPSASEGIYGANFIVDYTSRFGKNSINVGESHQDNFSFGIVVKAEPFVFVQIASSGVYQGKKTGVVTIKLVNNDVADIKFLTVELEESKDFEPISGTKEYIGDLDSDDFESVDFRIKSKKSKGEIILPLKLSYKDSMNKEYENRAEVVLKMYSVEELGLKKNNTFLYILLFVLVLGIGYYFYKRLKRKKRVFE